MSDGVYLAELQRLDARQRELDARQDKLNREMARTEAERLKAEADFEKWSKVTNVCLALSIFFAVVAAFCRFMAIYTGQIGH